VSVTAYHSFVGEVEASNTPTIRRLTLSRRHQLSPIAPSLHEPAKRAAAGWCVDMVDLNSLSSADEGILLRALSAAEAR
jgi:hypothetical protein